MEATLITLAAGAASSSGAGDVAGHHVDPLATLAGQFVEEVRPAGGGQHLRSRLVQHAREPRAQTR